jgi:sugar phosphate isomerase/epimerase
MVPLSSGYLNLADLDPASSLRAAAAGGFHAVGLRITGHRPSDEDLGIVGRADAIADLRAIMRDHGIGVANVSTYRVVPESRPDDYIPVLETAAALGAGIAVVNCFTPDRALAADTIAALCEMAESYKIRIGLEFIPVSSVRTVEDAAAIVMAANSPAAGIVVDALHLFRSGGTPQDLARIDPSFICSLQLCDAPLRAPDDLYAEMRAGRFYPGEGELPLSQLLDVLPLDRIEIEAEVPHARVADLPGAERARRAFEATRSFLDAYSAARQLLPQATAP